MLKICNIYNIYIYDIYIYDIYIYNVHTHMQIYKYIEMYREKYIKSLWKTESIKIYTLCKKCI